MYKRAIALTLFAAAIGATACGDDDNTTQPVSKIVNFTATMTPGGEPGALVGNPTGSGTFTASLDTSTNKFTWNGTFTGLTANASLGHIHGPFLQGASGSAGVILNFDPAVSTAAGFSGVTFTGLKAAPNGSFSGTAILNSSLQLTTAINGDSLRKLLLANAAYVNIHTATNAGGEIRGQIIKQP